MASMPLWAFTGNGQGLDDPMAGYFSATGHQWNSSAGQWQRTGNNGSSGTNSNSSGTSGSSTGSGSLFDDYKQMATLQFDQTKNLMSLSNQYREKEGATQRQVMDRSAQITEQQRSNDASRAQMALRNFRKMGF